MTPAMPAVTKAQILALVKDALAVAVAFGAPLNQTQQVALLALAGSSTIVLLAADAAIRHSRAKHLGPALLDQHFLESLGDPAPKPLTERIAEAAAAEAKVQAENDPKPPPAGTAPIQLAEQTEATGS